MNREADKSCKQQQQCVLSEIPVDMNPVSFAYYSPQTIVLHNSPLFCSLLRFVSATITVVVVGVELRKGCTFFCSSGCSGWHLLFCWLHYGDFQVHKIARTYFFALVHVHVYCILVKVVAKKKFCCLI